MKLKKKKSENSERWLLTYSDLITLLMILFILLYAMSSVDQAKYEQLATSLGGALGGGSTNKSDGLLDGSNGVLKGGEQIVPEVDSSTDENTEDTLKEPTQENTKDTTKGNTLTDSETEEKEEMQELKADVDKIISENNMGDDVGNTIKEEGLVISFSDKLFFDVGDAKLKDNMKNGLDQIAVVMNKIDNDILIEGHTDNTPIKNGDYDSNWQLSAIRAANVVQYLVEIDHVDGKRLSAIGYGDTKPVASNNKIEGRNQNRRIDIVVLYDSKN